MKNARKLRHRLQLQEQIETQDENTGAIDVVWQDLAEIWGEVSPLSGKEFVTAAEEKSKVTARILIRYRPIDSKQRIIHTSKNKIYNIEAVLDDNETGYDHITLMVSEGVRE